MYTDITKCALGTSPLIENQCYLTSQPLAGRIGHASQTHCRACLLSSPAVGGNTLPHLKPALRILWGGIPSSWKHASGQTRIALQRLNKLLLEPQFTRVSQDVHSGPKQIFQPAKIEDLSRNQNLMSNTQNALDTVQNYLSHYWSHSVVSNSLRPHGL